MHSQELLDEFKANIRAELDLCNPVDTPFVCANLSTQSDYQRIESLIITKVISRKITIGAAIIQIELDLNPQSYTE